MGKKASSTDEGQKQMERSDDLEVGKWAIRWYERFCELDYGSATQKEVDPLSGGVIG